jgi:phosphatidylglycerophosphate synthase
MAGLATTPPAARRPLKSRGSVVVRRVAGGLAARKVAPNAISIAGVIAAGAGAAALIGASEVDGTGQAALLAGAAVAVQLRLLCNLLDGLVAVEGGLATPDGELFNEVPDRLADSLLLVAAAYAASVPELGWAAALAAVLTAYVRALGGALGQPQDFSGLMSKPRRMALLTAACLGAVATLDVLAVAVGVIFAGSLVTAGGRLARLRRALR